MGHIKAVAIKLIASFAVLYIILGLFYGMSLKNVLLITLFLGAVSYVVGDMVILRLTNNWTATIADFGLALVIIWMMSRNVAYDVRPTAADNAFMMSLVASIFVTAFEYLFHKYIASHFNFTAAAHHDYNESQFQTEASDELSPNKKEE